MSGKNLEKVEYRVKTTERYVVTRYERDADGGVAVVERGTYSSPHVAYEVGYALAKQEQQQLGWPAFDERMTFPSHPLGPEHEATFRETGIVG